MLHTSASMSQVWWNLNFVVLTKYEYLKYGSIHTKYSWYLLSTKYSYYGVRRKYPVGSHDVTHAQRVGAAMTVSGRRRVRCVSRLIPSAESRLEIRFHKTGPECGAEIRLD